jgi:ESCRT-II complex subunit VPS25
MSFQWSWQYDFPPFFTLQPNSSTREKQLEAWASLSLDYCQHNKLYTTDLSELHQSQLFNNERIARQLNIEGVRAVFEVLEKQRHVEWLDKNHTRCHVYWRRPEEWGKLIYDWVVSNGLLNTVCTFYELTNGDDTAAEPFHGLDKAVLAKALGHLEQQNKAELITVSGNEGVKFFQ